MNTSAKKAEFFSKILLAVIIVLNISVQTEEIRKNDISFISIVH